MIRRVNSGTVNVKAMVSIEGTPQDNAKDGCGALGIIRE